MNATDHNLTNSSSEFIWSDNNETPAHRYLYPAVAAALTAHSAYRILDVGCGNGAFTTKLRGGGFHVDGIDGSETAIEQARKNGDGFALHSLNDPLPDEYRGRYSAVIATEVIEHLLLPRLLFLRAKEALTHGGKIVITTPYHGYWKNLIIAMINGYDKHWHPLRDYGHIKFFSTSTLCQMISEQGFKVESVARVGRVPQLAKSMVVSARYE